MTDNRFHYAIPTEYQWEWAAKGGIFSHGYSFAGSDNLDEVSWYSGNSNKSLQKIGGKQPNELGLFDMSGLLLEWCSTRVEIKGSSKSADNCYDIQCYYHREEIKDGNLEINGNNTESNIERASTYAQRGGSYDSGTEKCKILHRSWGYSHVGHEWNGLRIISRVPENYERPVRQLVKQQENSKPTSNSESKGFIGNVLKKVFG